MRWRRLVVGGAVSALAALAALACACAMAEVPLVLPTSDLPGLHAAGVSPRQAERDLAAGLSGGLALAVADAQVQTSAAAGASVRLRSDAFVFGSAAVARRVLSAWRGVHHARAVRVGDGGYLAAGRAGRQTQITIAWRDAGRVGLIRLSARGSAGRVAELATAFADVADSWLRSPLPQTAFARVLAEARPDGTWSKTTALQAFAATYGPLPGVRIPAGPETEVVDGTAVAESIESYLPELSRPQRLVVERLLGIPTSGHLAREANLGDASFKPDPVLQMIVRQIHPQVRSEAESPPRAEGRGRDDKRAGGDAEGRLRAGGRELAQHRRSDPHWNPGDLPAPADAEGSEEERPVHRADIRARAVPLLPARPARHDAVSKLPPWIGEGTADWAAATIDPSPWSLLSKFLELKSYVESPTTPLFDHAYDSAFFWGHVQDTIGNLWNVMKPVIIDGENRKSFVDSGADAGGFLNSWGSSFLRLPGGQGGAPCTCSAPLRSARTRCRTRVPKPRPSRR